MFHTSNVGNVVVAINPIECRIYTPSPTLFDYKFVWVNEKRMEVITLENDMNLFCVTARSFPHEIKQAFDQLVRLIHGTDGRTFFGISYQTDSGTIIYKAAVLESYPGEGERLGCELYRLEKGDYITEAITDWMKDTRSIGTTFRKLGDSRPETTFPCVEWYKGNDVLCMVKLELAKK